MPLGTVIFVGNLSSAQGSLSQLWFVWITVLNMVVR